MTSATLSGPVEGTSVLTNMGVIQPKQGDTFTVLSSGKLGVQPEPGTDFFPLGTEGDRVVLTLVLDLPVGVNHLGFTYNFLSTEIPDYLGSIYNDTFTVVLTDSNGVREVARASVNSSNFVPASNVNAGGSGYDIFTEDPSEVDYIFEGGLPDAGLTEFKLVNTSVNGGEQVKLEFTIEDRGDGFLDSAVVIDNLVVSSLEVVDPNPIFLTNGNITTDTDTLSQNGVVVNGATADGITKVLLRSTLPEPGIVEFCLKDAVAPEDGGLTTLNNQGRNQCVNVPTISTPIGLQAFAIYQVPDEFNRGGDEALEERSINFNMNFIPNSGGTAIQSQVPFTLKRPPTLLIHGLWSNSGTWTFPLVSDPRLTVVRVDYEASHAAHFSTNSLVPFSFVREAVTRMRNEGIAATQVDVVGHSMGGIIGRVYVNTQNYERSNNFNEGDFNKLITVDTPHTGSPLPSLIQSIRNLPLVGGPFESAMASSGRNVTDGAIEDLSVGSLALANIGQTPIPSHAIVGIGGSDALENIPGWIGSMYTIINFFADSSDLFQGLQHDALVGRQSQEGGMPTSAYTVIGGFESIHSFNTNSPIYSNHIIELLNTSINSSSFTEFPAPNSVQYLTQNTTNPLPSVILEENSGKPFSTEGETEGLVITSPTEGAIVTPGEIVTITVEPLPGKLVESVLLIGPDVAMTDNEAPFNFPLELPLEAVGNFEISAIGKNSDGDVENFFTSNQVSLQAQPNASLESITIVPQDIIFFSANESRNLTILGEYSDDVIRDITDPSTGIEYLSSNPTFVTVSSDGIVESVDLGISTIVARLGSVQDSINASVLSTNQIPIARAGADFMVPRGSLVTLDGSASSDPDNSPQNLSYEWLQIAGPNVFLSGSTTATPSFIATEAGFYTFSLVVRDGQADSMSDSITVFVISDVVYLPIVMKTD